MRSVEKYVGPLRLVWAAGFGALSLLAIFAAPTSQLWQVAVGVTGWGHMLAPVALLPLLPGWRLSKPGRSGAVLGLGAALLFLSPLIRALPIDAALPAQLSSAFGEPARPPARPGPIVAADLFRGVARPQIGPQTLSYSAADGSELLLDLYPAQTAGPAPLVVMIHGGAWEGGSRDDLPALNHYLAGRGYSVAAISYRFAPQHPFPAASADVDAAIAFLRANAAELAIDPSRIVLIGRSAGGHLALLSAYRHNDPAVRGVVSFYGPTDLHYGYANPRNPLVIETRRILEGFIAGTPETAAEQYSAASPISYVGPQTPPTLLLHGRRDELVWFADSERLAERLAAAGRPHLLVDLPWATHAMDFNFDGPDGQISTYAIEYFLNAVMDH
ncbi:MAG: alpha/beta hydrolase [Oscillochloris sp.]|nr:alpha/beta hydrolase [Oscillochloris sp.]